MQFDIDGFYPSISEDLLKKSINYARTFVDISSHEEETIMQCQKLYFSIKRATRILMLLWVALMAQKFASWLVLIFCIY